MIAVLLCTYNGESFLREQMDSILGSRDLEEPLCIIASDDGSTDRTPEILREYESRFPEQVQVLQEQPATGSACRHFLKLLADRRYGAADYIMLCDQDDVWDPEKVSRTRAAMEALEKSCPQGMPLLVHCDSRVVDSQLREIAPSYVGYQKMTPSRKAFHQLLVQNNVVGGALMMNRSLAERIRVVPEHAVMHDQWIALVAAVFGQISFLPEALYSYRQHGSNVLGAEKGSRFREVLGRFGIGRRDGKSKKEVDEASRRVYREMFQEAGCFLSIYGRELPKQHRDTLFAFLRIPRQPRLMKIVTILRYGFTYNLLHRTIGECLFII